MRFFSQKLARFNEITLFTALKSTAKVFTNGKRLISFLFNFVKPRKRFVSLAFVLVFSVTAYAFGQSLPEEYAIDSMIIFPDSVTSTSWKNVETLNEQNLLESSLYQQFSKENSAYLTNFRDKDEEVAVEVTPEEETTAQEDTTPDSTEEGGVASTSEEVVEGGAEAETQVIEDIVEEVPVKESAVHVGTSTVFNTVKGAFAFVFSSARELLPFTQSATTTETEEVVVEEPVTEEPAPVEEEATHVDIATTSEPVEEVTPETVEEIIPTTTPEVATTTTEVPTTTPATPTSTPETESATSTEAVEEEYAESHSIRLSGFAVPLEEGTEVTGGQLRMSFAAKEKLDFGLESHSLTVNYSFDGGSSWQSGGFIDIDDEVSNSINGGYFLFALPSIEDPAQLDSLMVEITYTGDSTILDGIFLDSTWLELFIASQVESEEAIMPFTLPDNGYDYDVLSGDELTLPDGREVEFTFTDENAGETLIIKTDKREYVGLTEAVAYFNITNTSNEADTFTVQTHFENGVGEMTGLKEWNHNKPHTVVIPEYRPFVYHCEAGWEEYTEPAIVDFEDFATFAEPEETEVFEETIVTPETATATTEISEVAEEVLSSVETPTTSTQGFETLTGSSSEELIVASATGTATVTPEVIEAVKEILEEETVEEVIEEVLEEELTEDDDTQEQQYVCGATNVVRVCDSIEGDGTACKIENKKVEEHVMEEYRPGWEKADVASGTPSDNRNVLEKVVNFFGFGEVERKEIPETFSDIYHSPNTFTIAPGETKYFKMDLTFPPFSQGEFWIEAIGKDSLYGLLDPFWDSNWQYRLPITLDNATSTDTLTEHQVYLQLDTATSVFWSNVKSDGGDIRFIQESGGTQSDWYSTSWSYRMEITVQSSQVYANQVEFPIYLDLSTFGSEFFNSINSDGGDIRVTASDGQTELAREIVSASTTAQTGEVYFQADSISSTTDTTFYVYYGNGTVSDYAITDPFGAENVWNNEYEAVLHFEEDPGGTAPQYLDSTANDHDATVDAMDSSNQVAGQFGSGFDADGSSEAVTVPGFTTLGTSNREYAIGIWFNADTGETDGNIVAMSSQNPPNAWRLPPILMDSDNVDGFSWPGSSRASGVTSITQGDWYQAYTTWNSSEGLDIYLNGSLDGNNTQATFSASGGSNFLHLSRDNNGGAGNEGYFNGQSDELRVLNTSTSTEWIATEYNNMSAPTTFYATSSEELAQTTFSELDFWLQHWSATSTQADVWVQVDSIAAGTSTTIYLYYGNSSATTTSDEYAPFTYSTTTVNYYAMDEHATGPIDVYSLIDNNIVQLDNSTPVALDKGETTSLSGYNGSSTIRTLGPISATINNSVSDAIGPISFATTSHAVPTERNTSQWYIVSPFASTSVQVYDSDAGAPTENFSIATGSVATSNVEPGGADTAVIESSEPVLVYHYEVGDRDSVMSYPATTEDIYGIDSRNTHGSSFVNGTDASVYCSGGNTGSSTNIDRGEVQDMDICTQGADGDGDAIRITDATNPVMFAQQADEDGSETTIFLPHKEFGTEYFFAGDSAYASVACAPRFGTSTIQVQTNGGTLVEEQTCAPADPLPGQAYFVNGGNPDNVTFTAGHKIISTNGVPFYVYYEDVEEDEDETNIWGSVQAKKFTRHPIGFSLGEQEVNNDAAYEQRSYYWFENNGLITPTSSWPLDDEGGTVDEGTPITGGGAVSDGQILRLRMNLVADVATGTTGSLASFKLQYGQASTNQCGTITEVGWNDVGQIGSTTAAFSGYNNGTLNDGALITSTTLASSTVFETYEEQNITAVLQNEIGIGEAGEWDWVIQSTNATSSQNYCFRMIRSNGTALATYTAYPQLETSGPPNAPTLDVYFDNERTDDLDSVLEFVTTDLAGDDVHYQIQIATTTSFGSPDVDRNSITNFNEFENINDGSDKAPFDSGAPIRFTSPTTLTASTTYWWRVRAQDPDGSGSYGDWSEPDSFTTDQSVTVSEWFQTTDEQFETDSITSATTTGSDSVTISIGDATLGEYGSMVLTNGVTTTINLYDTYVEPIIVASPQYSRTITDGEQPISRIVAKTATTFDVINDNFAKDATGTSGVSWIVMEAGEYLIDDGSSGIRVYASTTNNFDVNSAPLNSGFTGTSLTFPTSFNSAPVVIATVVSANDNDGIMASVYDGSTQGNPPDAAGMGVLLNENLDSNGHSAAEDIDFIAFEQGDGTNSGVEFNIVVSADTVGDATTAIDFDPDFASAPQFVAVMQLGQDGNDGGYAMVDEDVIRSSSSVNVAIDEASSTPFTRGHTDEQVGVVAFLTSTGTIYRAGSGQVVSSEIDFDDATVGNAWGEMNFTTLNAVSIHIEYDANGTFVDIPDTALPGNSTGFTSSPVNILDLDTDTYNKLRLVAELSGGAPELFDWNVVWGQRVDTVTLEDPFDNEKIATTTPTLEFTTTDPQSDDLEYEVSWSTDNTFTTGTTTVNSSTSPGFTDTITGSTTGPFASGNTISYKLTQAQALTNGVTYWWRVRARDPEGGNAFSPWSDPDSLTVDTSVTVSTWFQTTAEQFQTGTLTGASASTTAGMVTNDVTVAEFGTVVLDNGSSTVVSLLRTYNDPVVVTSVRYSSTTDVQRVSRVLSKSSDSFLALTDNFDSSVGGTTTVDYFAIEDGDWTIVDGGTGMRVLADTISNVSVVRSNDVGDGLTGSTVTFDTAFSSSPTVIHNISSNNDNEWAFSSVHSQSDVTLAPTSVGFIAWLNRGFESAVHDAEDIDYVAFEQGHGTNNGSEFDFEVSADNITGVPIATSFDTAFSSPPGVTLVAQLTQDGGNGGYVHVDTDNPTTASDITLRVDEDGSGADRNHTNEIAGIAAFEDNSGLIYREDTNATVTSPAIPFSDGGGPKFERYLFYATSTGGSTTTLQVEYLVGTSTWALIPDSAVPGNSVGTTTSPVDLTNVDVSTYDTLRLVARLECNGLVCPTLNDWTVEWSEGVEVSGTLQEYDRTTNVNSGTVRVAVNGVLSLNTGTVSAGTWTVNNITAFEGDVVTVYLQGASDTEEAGSVFVYDGSGDMTGVTLYEQHLTIAADENGTTSLASLSQYDNSVASGNEDVFWDVNASGYLETCDAALTGCGRANLYIGSNQLFVPTSTASLELTAHDYINTGEVELDSNTLRLSGSWYNFSTTTMDTSTVIMSATSTIETMEDTFTDVLGFNNLTFGETSGSATWQTAKPLDIDGNLVVDYGTLNRASSTITVTGNLTTGANGFWSGISTTTFDSMGGSSWTDNNASNQNIGYVIIDGDAKTVTMQSDVRASTLTIAANDILDAGGSNTLELLGNFTNNNTFTPRTSTVDIIATSSSITLTPGASSFYNLTFSGANTASAFASANATVLHDFTIATGTVTMPSATTTVSGSFFNTGGTFAHNNGEVDFAGSGTEVITASGTPFLNNFYNLTFSGSGDWSFTDVNATTSNIFAGSDGTVTMPSGIMTVGANFTMTGGGAFAHNNGEVIFLINDSDSILSNGSSFNDTRFRSGGASGVWLDLDWDYRVPVVIQSTQVPSTTLDFPVYLNLSDFAAHFFTNLNSDGGDIRVTQSDGVTEVAREIVSASTTAQTGEVYFLANSISSTTDTTFYVYYGNNTASDYASTSLYGSQNVWTNDFEAVLHFEEDPGGAAPQYEDSTGNEHRGSVGLLDSGDQVAGQIGNAIEFNGTDEYIVVPGFTGLGTSNRPYAMGIWFNAAVGETSGNIIAMSQSDPISGWNLPPIVMNSDNVDGYSWAPGASEASGVTDINQGDWYQTYTTWSSGPGLDIYLNGVVDGNNTQAGYSASGASNFLHLARQNTGAGNQGFFEGQLDELRVFTSTQDSDWIRLEYNNMSTSSDFYNLATQESSPGRTFLDSNTSVLGDVVIESGTVVFPTGVLTVGGSFDNNDIFDNASGTVRFNSTSGSETIAAGTSTFATVDFDSTTGTWTIIENATATDAFTLTNVGDFTLNSGLVIESTGTFNNSAEGASTTWTGSTIRLSSGTTYEINASTTPGDAYSTLLLTGGTDISMWNSTSSFYTTSATSSVYSQDHNGVDGELYIYGNYERTSGTEYWTYATDFDGTPLLASTSRAVNVYVGDNATVTIATSTLRMTGVAGASSSIGAVSGSYALIGSNASITADYYEFSGMNVDGLQLLASTTLSNFDNGLFTVETSRSGITVDAETVDTNPASQFFDVNYSTSTGGAVNVTLSGSPTSYWWFRDGTGNLYGEAFDNGDGNPGSIRWDDSAFTVNISGVVYSDDGDTFLGGPTCDGSTENLRVVVDGGSYSSTTSCSGLDGSFTFNSVQYNGDAVLTIYLDTDGGEKGVVVTRTPTVDITDMNVYANRVMTRHEDTDAMTIALMTHYDEADDTDIGYVAATGTPDTLTVRPGWELMIASSTTFAPGGNITVQSGGGGDVWDGSFHIDDNAIFTASTTESHSVGGSFFSDTGATFTSASTTFTFTSTTTGRTITASSSLTFNELQFTGGGGGWNLNTDITVLGSTTVATGTLTGTGSITIPYGVFTGNGLVSLGGGTVTLERSSTLGGTQGWTFNNLTLGNGSVVGTTTPASTATTTVNGVLTISTAHFLDAGSSEWSLGGTGNVFVENGTFLEDTSTVRYSGNTSANILSTMYYNLDLNALSGTPTYTGTGAGIQVLNNLTVGGDSTTTATFNTSDPALDVANDVIVRSNGTLVGSNSASFTVNGSWDNDGTYTGSGGTVTFDGSGTETIAAGNSSFSNVVINGTGDFTVIENATATAAFTLTDAASFTQQSGTALAVGGTFSNTFPNASTTWLGSTLYLYGGTNYEVNASTTADFYDTFMVGADTDVRVWNFTATTTTVDASGSLYSQDHNSVDGDLYIYGTYPGNGGTDYWNYARDFDGRSLSGIARRKVDVYVENGGGIAYIAGGLQILGTTTASTTVQNQGSGSYSMRVGGSASTSMQYYEIRNSDSDGLTFSGTPTVITLSFGDFLVTEASGSGITVGGTALNANPALTFTQNRFATNTVIAASNVTATGTSVSSWRFTNHVGNIAGEDFDTDPGGDPGYIVWDNSTSSLTISGNVYEDEGVLTSDACDGSTNNIVLVVAGLTTYQTSCDGDGGGGGSGFYSISDVNVSAGDPIIVYIDGEPEKAAVVSRDLVSDVSDMDLYENRVIVRHEGSDPLTIANMALWDGVGPSGDADIQFTAVDAGTDTLTVASDNKLLVWTNKEFEPAGNVTLSGGGAGAAYDGTLELYDDADWTSNVGESHSVGGSMILRTGANVDASTATFTFTTSGAARTIDLNEDSLYNATFNGSGSWTITDPTFTATHDVTITSGTLTLPSGTTTVGGSFDNTGGTFDANDGLLYFTSTGAGETIEAGGSDIVEILFNGSGGAWTFNDTHATVTGSFSVATGSVTLPSGVLAVGNNFNATDTVAHNTGTLRTTNATSADITLNGNDLYSVTVGEPGTITLRDTSAAFLGDLTMATGTFISATGTLSIGGSFDAQNGIFTHSTGTILFNSSDTGETVDPGNNLFYNVQFSSAGGGWTLQSATATNNFSLTAASSFTLTSGEVIAVENIFTNTVGGSATTWLGSTLRLLSASNYTINTKSAGGDQYDTLFIIDDADIRSWDSAATTTQIATSSSLYSQDHAGTSGDLYIFGDFHIATGTEYWNYTNDFDGTAIGGGGERQVNVYIADEATTTIESTGTLEIVGDGSATTTIQNQGTGTYVMNVTGGTLNASYYSFINLGTSGLTLTGSPTISSLSNGEYTLSVDSGVLISVSTTTVNANASKIISGTRFSTTTAISGTNVSLTGGTTTNSWTFVGHAGNLDGELYDIDGATDCGSIRWDDSSCLLAQQTHYRWRNDDGGEGAPDSEWFNTSWDKRKRIRLDNADASTYTNAAIKLDVTYDSDMQADFDDLRFTDSTGTTTISHWTEEYTASTDATVWVEVPTLTANDTTIIYMYYDNVTATTTSSSTEVFIVADDFEDGDIDEYSGSGADLARLDVTSNFAFGGSFGLDASPDETDRADDGISRSDLVVSQGEIIRYMQYIDTGSGSSDEVCTLFGVQEPVGNNSNYAVCLEQFLIDRMSLVRDAVNTDTSAAQVLASTTVSYSTGWYEVEIDWQTDDTIDVELFNSSGSLVASVSATDSNYSTGTIGFTFWGQHGGWDSYVSRPRVDTEPTVYFGAEQVDGGATWAEEQDTLSDSFEAGDTARLRIAIENTGLDITSQVFQLEYAAKDSAPNCESVDYSDYVEVPNQGSCGSSPICMQTSANVTDLEATSDHLISVNGTYVEGDVVESPSNESGSYNVNQNNYTELEYVITPTVNASDAYCFRVTNDGTDLDSYTAVPEIQVRFNPTISALSLNGGADIVLTQGATTTIYATGTVSDLNGYTDLNTATATIFRSGVTSSCTADLNNCYISGDSLCSFVSCAGNTCDLECTADIYYFAEPTDAGSPDAGESWIAFAQIEDNSGAVATATAPSVDLQTVRAITVSSTLNYGSLNVGADTGSFNATSTVQNIGNDFIDISVEGVDLTDGGASTIDVAEQIYATSTFTYSSCVFCSTLATTSSNYEVDLDKPTTTTPGVTDDVYWGINVPFGTAGTAHQGTNTFYAIGD